MFEIAPLEAQDLTEAGIVVEAAYSRRGMAESLRNAHALQPGYWFCLRRLGRIVATVGAYGYRGSGSSITMASIGMMAVHPQFQHQGLGRQLMEHLVDHLTRAGYPALFLEASVAGQRLYPQLGFWPGGDTLRMVQHTPVRVSFPAGGAVERMAASDLADVIAYDGSVFGMERPLILRTLFERYPRRAFICRDGSQVLSGYLLASGMTFGPWSAGSPAAAELLLQAALTLPRLGEPRVTFPGRKSRRAGTLAPLRIRGGRGTPAHAPGQRSGPTPLRAILWPGQLDARLVNRGRCLPLLSQFPDQYRHSLAAQQNALSCKANAHDAAARRSLEAHHLALAQARGPVRRQATVGRAGHRVLGHACGRAEPARHEVVLGRGGAGSHDDPAHGHVGQAGQNPAPGCALSPRRPLPPGNQRHSSRHNAASRPTRPSGRWAPPRVPRA